MNVHTLALAASDKKHHHRINTLGLNHVGDVAVTRSMRHTTLLT